jgi:hypothetical protein
MRPHPYEKGTWASFQPTLLLVQPHLTCPSGQPLTLEHGRRPLESSKGAIRQPHAGFRLRYVVIGRRFRPSLTGYLESRCGWEGVAYPQYRYRYRSYDGIAPKTPGSPWTTVGRDDIRPSSGTNVRWTKFGQRVGRVDFGQSRPPRWRKGTNRSPDLRTRLPRWCWGINRSPHNRDTPFRRALKQRTYPILPNLIRKHCGRHPRRHKGRCPPMNPLLRRKLVPLFVRGGAYRGPPG